MHPAQDSRDSAFTLVEVLVATAIAVGAAIVVGSGATRILLAERSAIESNQIALLLRTVEAAHNNPRIATEIQERENPDWSIDNSKLEADEADWSLWTLGSPSGRVLETAFGISD